MKLFNLNLINSQIDLLRSQTALIKGNARFPILEIAKAIPASRKICAYLYSSYFDFS